MADLNHGQQAAVEVILSGANVFLTGEGGTGKSVCVREAVRLLERAGHKVILCAPTGIAAILVGGATIHSAFGFSTAPKIADELDAVSASKEIHAADTVIIDEIGMVRRDMMDAIARVVELENEARQLENEAIEKGEEEGKKRKPLQLVAVGDFSQLPPVVTDKDKPALTGFYGPKSARTGFYAFESAGWKRLGFCICQLTEVMRQSDQEFVTMLNRARVGDASCISYFNALAERSEPVPNSATSLVNTNKRAGRINASRLGELEGELVVLRGEVDGEFETRDMPAPSKLELKEGARVLCMANNRENGYVNGSTGEVVDVLGTSAAGEPAVIVKLDGGEEVAVVKNTWENTVYRYDEKKERLEKKVRGSYTQFPLKLAWAITYHKSQGQTLDAVSIDPDTFGPGMLYVGLSRATSPAGIWLTRKIEEKDLVAEKAVVAFYENACGWTPPAPASGDETPKMAENEPKKPVSPVVNRRGKGHTNRTKKEPRPKAEKMTSADRKNDSDDLDEIHSELHDLLGRGGRTWFRVYELIDRVSREQLWKDAGYRSFSAWLRAEAEREGVAISYLWHQKSAGDFYNAWSDGREDAPSLADGDSLSESNLNLVRKIAKVDAERADELMQKMVGERMSTKELRREWSDLRQRQREDRAVPKPESPQSKAKARANRNNLSISVDCVSSGAFDTVLKALKSAGVNITVC